VNLEVVPDMLCKKTTQLVRDTAGRLRWDGP
jgi:hypothetical protein